MSYLHYMEVCALCCNENPKREMNKLYISYGHTSVSSPKKICSICDDCLPTICENFEITLPDKNVNFYRRRYCKKCYKDVRKDALYCQYCGNKLSDAEKGGE